MLVFKSARQDPVIFLNIPDFNYCGLSLKKSVLLKFFLYFFSFQTREELRVALEAEMRAFTEDRDVRGAMVVAWNHQEFEVHSFMQYLIYVFQFECSRVGNT